MRVSKGVAVFTALLLPVGALANQYTYVNAGGRMESGSGLVQTETRTVEPFTRIRSDISANVIISIGTPIEVKVSIDDNLLDNIRTRVRHNTLEISSRGSWSTEREANIEIRVPSVDMITSEGSGAIVVNNLSGERLIFRQEGSGEFQATGKVRSFEVVLDGSGDISARGLQAENVSVVVNGSGNVQVTALASFDGVVNGSGNIDFWGNPAKVSRHVSGSGDIDSRK